MKDLGASADADQALAVPATPANAVDGPSGFDPSRIAWLHLRGQFTYHAEARIIGTRAGLEALRDAVTDALRDGKGEASVMASDGEGYGLEIVRSRTVSGLGKPTYLDQEARELAYYEREYLVRESKSRRKIEKEAFDALRWCRVNGDPHKAIATEARRAETLGSVHEGAGPQDIAQNPSSGNHQ